MEIKLLEGLDDIEFGATAEDVAEVFGKPDEIEELEEGDDELKTVIWSLTTLELRFSLMGGT